MMVELNKDKDKDNKTGGTKDSGSCDGSKRLFLSIIVVVVVVVGFHLHHRWEKGSRSSWIIPYYSFKLKLSLLHTQS